MTRSELEIIIKKRAAFFIVTFAALLAFNAQIGGSNSSKISANTIAANNHWTHYGTKNVKASIATANAKMAEADGRPHMLKLAESFRQEATRMREEPKDGMNDIAKSARALEAERDRRAELSPYFTYAGLALQIGIVLSTAAILAVFLPLFYGSVVVGSFGVVLFTIGYLGV